MTFHVGQKVFCWYDGFGPRESAEVAGAISFPEAGNTYTIREIRPTITYCGTVIGLLLEEIVNVPLPYLGGVDHRELAFDQNAFRPLVEGQTDISIFTEILDRENAKPRKRVTTRA